MSTTPTEEDEAVLIFTVPCSIVPPIYGTPLWNSDINERCVHIETKVGGYLTIAYDDTLCADDTEALQTDFHVLLNEPTGRAHVAWWIRREANRDFGKYARDVLDAACSGDDMTVEAIESLRDLCVRIAVEKAASK